MHDVVIPILLSLPDNQVRASSQSGAAAAPRMLSYNPAENAVLVSSDADGGSYQLYMVPKDGRADSGAVRTAADIMHEPLRHARCDVNQQATMLHLQCVLQIQCRLYFPALQEAKRGLGTTAVFIARNRFAVLDKGANQIQIRNLQNEVGQRLRLDGHFGSLYCGHAHAYSAHPDPQITKKSNSPTATTDAIFYAGTGALLCRSEDKVRSNASRLRHFAAPEELCRLRSASVCLQQRGHFRLVC